MCLVVRRIGARHFAGKYRVGLEGDQSGVGLALRQIGAVRLDRVKPSGVDELAKAGCRRIRIFSVGISAAFCTDNKVCVVNHA